MELRDPTYYVMITLLGYRFGIQMFILSSVVLNLTFLLY